MMKFKTHHYRHCLCFSRVLQKMKNCEQIIISKIANQRYRKTDSLQLVQLNHRKNPSSNRRQYFSVEFGIVASIMVVKHKSNLK